MKSDRTMKTKDAFGSLLYLIASSLFITLIKGEAQCLRRKYLLGTSSIFNTTIKCPDSFQWTISDHCCYDMFDRFETKPFCCYSETFKLVIAVGILFLAILGTSFTFFFCWIYNLPHHILFLISCRKFKLNEWLRTKGNSGTYVDPSFYSGDPFWARGSREIQPYPLRPMPPRIFYPSAPHNKYRWEEQAAAREMPLFVVASRQFTRNPYSARPTDRHTRFIAQEPSSRRSSNSSHQGFEPHRTYPPPSTFQVNIDEVEAAAELLEAIKNMDEKKGSGALKALHSDFLRMGTNDLEPEEVINLSDEKIEEKNNNIIEENEENIKTDFIDETIESVPVEQEKINIPNTLFEKAGMPGLITVIEND